MNAAIWKLHTICGIQMVQEQILEQKVYAMECAHFNLVKRYKRQDIAVIFNSEADIQAKLVSGHGEILNNE